MGSTPLSSLPHILLGDFNSLGYPTDYPLPVWSSITQTRKINNWEPPKWKVISSLLGPPSSSTTSLNAEVEEETAEVELGLLRVGDDEKYRYLDTWKMAGASPSMASCW